MKVTGFTIIKDAIKFDFPVKEAIESILPICDKMVVAVGDSTDGTRKLIESISPQKIEIIDTVWNKNLNTGGAVLADETNKAFQAIDPETDWCFYIQADEVLHEKYLDVVRKKMLECKDDARVDGLLFKYLHFYGSYDYVGGSSSWYKKEIRVVRNKKSIYSYRDAQGFRKGNDEKLHVKEVDASIYHYGWVREPKKMNAKLMNTHNYWGGIEYDEQRADMNSNDFDYTNIDYLVKFKGAHPEVMKERIKRKNWQFDYDITKNKRKTKDILKDLLEKITGRRFFDYKNYVIVK